MDVRIQVQRNMGVTNIIDDGHALVATIESFKHSFCWLPCECNEKLNLSTLQLSLPCQNLGREIAKGPRQFMHAKMNKTLWPTIIGKWVPLSREETCLYKFKTERNIISIVSLKRSNEKGKMHEFM
jgi:hypothetical protein